MLHLIDIQRREFKEERIIQKKKHDKNQSKNERIKENQNGTKKVYIRVFLNFTSGFVFYSFFLHKFRPQTFWEDDLARLRNDRPINVLVSACRHQLISSLPGTIHFSSINQQLRGTMNFLRLSFSLYLSIYLSIIYHSLSKTKTHDN